MAIKKIVPNKATLISIVPCFIKSKSASQLITIKDSKGNVIDSFHAKTATPVFYDGNIYAQSSNYPIEIEVFLLGNKTIVESTADGKTITTLKTTYTKANGARVAHSIPLASVENIDCIIRYATNIYRPEDVLLTVNMTVSECILEAGLGGVDNAAVTFVITSV